MLIEWGNKGIKTIKLEAGDSLQLYTQLGPVTVEVDDQGVLSLNCQNESQANRLIQTVFSPADGAVVDMEQVRWNGYERQVKLRNTGLDASDIVDAMIEMANDDEAWSFNSGDLSSEEYNKLWGRLFKQVGESTQKGEMP